MMYDEWEEILAMLRSDADRARFQELFAWGPEGDFESTNADWSKDKNEVTTMLSAVGYVERRYRSKFLIEGRELLEQFLKEHPHNADAWNMDLLHYIGYPGEAQFVAYQMERIGTALKNCPDDPTIRLWADLGRLSQQRQAEVDNDITPTEHQRSKKQSQLDKQLEKRGVYDFRFKQRSYGYYFR